MHAMQYEITLPADYNMEIIRRRVETRGALLDDYPGLGLKAYAIRCRGVAGSPVNQYAPFYLWNRVHSMSSFLLGEGFAGLCASFGRPRVPHWVGLSFTPGPAFGELPRAATKLAVSLAPDDDVADVLDRNLRTNLTSTDPGLHATVLVLDPARWEVVRFSLWHDRAHGSEGIAYEVLRVSAPELDKLVAEDLRTAA
jgi:uncharacterized protein DUF4865